jgi:hypothetical protein
LRRFSTGSVIIHDTELVDEFWETLCSLFGCPIPTFIADQMPELSDFVTRTAFMRGFQTSFTPRVVDQ